jgi:hypothetical protein
MERQGLAALAEYRPTGMVTRPKLMAPFQIGRGMSTCSAPQRVVQPRRFFRGFTRVSGDLDVSGGAINIGERVRCDPGANQRREARFSTSRGARLLNACVA